MIRRARVYARLAWRWLWRRLSGRIETVLRPDVRKVMEQIVDRWVTAAEKYPRESLHALTPMTIALTTFAASRRYRAQLPDGRITTIRGRPRSGWEHFKGHVQGARSSRSLCPAPRDYKAWGARYAPQEYRDKLGNVISLKRQAKKSARRGWALP